MNIIGSEGKKVKEHSLARASKGCLGSKLQGSANTSTLNDPSRHLLGDTLDSWKS